MSDWSWVAYAYALVYVTLLGYVWSMAARTRRARIEMHRR